jgi:hypothetical protein
MNYKVTCCCLLENYNWSSYEIDITCNTDFFSIKNENKYINALTILANQIRNIKDEILQRPTIKLLIVLKIEKINSKNVSS